MSHHQFDLSTYLHRQGYRSTPQRQMVLDAVCEAAGHATPEQVYALVQRRSKAVNKATVYRALKFLTSLGIITANSRADGRLEYELAGQRPHHHLACRGCGADIEFSDALLATCIEAIAREHGFRVEPQHITLQGLCEACQVDGGLHEAVRLTTTN